VRVVISERSERNMKKKESRISLNWRGEFVFEGWSKEYI